MNRLKTLRLEHNLQQNKLAREIGITNQAYSLYELEKRNPTLSSFRALAAYYGVSLEYLLELTDDPTPVDPQEQSALSETELTAMALFASMTEAERALTYAALEREIEQQAWQRKKDLELKNHGNLKNSAAEKKANAAKGRGPHRDKQTRLFFL